MDRNLDLEDIVYLGFCSDLLHEYLDKITTKEIYLRLNSNSDDLTKDQLQFLDKYDDYSDYYLGFISKLGKLFDKNYDKLASYIDSNKILSFENEDTSLAKANFNLPSYGLGNITLTKNVLLDYDWMEIDLDYKDFKPYRKYNFIDEDVLIRLKEREQNDNNLSDEYALLPEKVIIDEKLDYKKQGTNQYPLKNFRKGKRKKHFILMVIINIIIQHSLITL